MKTERASLRMGKGLSRRELVATAVASLGATAMHAQGAARTSERAVACLFSKPLGNRPFTDLPAVLNELGVDAVDLTCRGGGHVLPERVTDDLPKAIALLKAGGISVPMITTEITDANKGNAEAIIRTAAALGIRYAKTGYYRYDDRRGVLASLADAKAKLRDVAALFKQHDITAGYHNHSGFYVGAAMWDVWQLVQDLPREAAGSYFDLGHATVEGGDSGWRIGLDLLLPRVVMVAVKDFTWAGAKDWRPSWGPMGAGRVRFGDAFSRLKTGRFAGPVALHVEYGRYGKTVGSADDRQTLANIRRDWVYLREQLAEAGLI